MKTLLIVRHAKSSWDPAVTSDFDRSLNERGKNDAPEMARKILAAGITPDLLISSPAKRALKTARLFAEVFDKGKEEIVLIDNLYEPVLGAFYAVVAGISAEVNVAAIFSHNPGVTDFVNSLSDMRVDDMPTCGVFAITFDGDNWADFSRMERKFLFFKYPKELN